MLLCDGAELHQAHFALPENVQALDSGQGRQENSAATVDKKSSGEHRVASGTTLQEMEKNLIQQTLDDLDGNVSKAARRLGISRDRLRYRLEKYQLKRK